MLFCTIDLGILSLHIVLGLEVYFYSGRASVIRILEQLAEDCGRFAFTRVQKRS